MVHIAETKLQLYTANVNDKVSLTLKAKVFIPLEIEHEHSWNVFD